MEPQPTRRLWPFAVLTFVALCALSGAALFAKPHVPLRPLFREGEFFVERCYSPGVFMGRNVFSCIALSHWVTQADFDCDGDGVTDSRGWYFNSVEFERCESWDGRRWKDVPCGALPRSCSP